MELCNYIQLQWIDLILCAGAGGVIAYCATMWFEDALEFRKQTEQEIHNQILNDDFMSIDEINHKLNQLEKAQKS